MTLTFGTLRITLKIERIKRFTVTIDTAAAQQAADEIKQTDYFQTLRQQAALIRAERL